MSAIITENLKIRNCTNFINDVVTNENYYTFIGLSNSSEYQSDWNTNTPDPVDNSNYLDSYKNTILGVKKISSTDIIRVIPKIVWKTGTKYDMYRHDYSRYNLTPNTNFTSLADSRYYVMNSEYRVYICINNGASPSNLNLGVASVNEPVHTSESPEVEDDGYIWKYLYTITPADFIKFDSTDYISVPNYWDNDSFNTEEIRRIKDASVDGKIETILVESSTSYAVSTNLLTNIQIIGDGVGGEASVEFDDELKPIKVTVTSGGSGYTFATLDLDSVVSPISEKSVFNVIIPPPGGHGRNVYKELNCNKVLVYSRIENTLSDPDFIEGNQFSRVGIIRDIKDYAGSSTFTNNTGSGVFALKLTTDASSEIEDSKISQASTGAIGSLVSVVSLGTSCVIKYTKPREWYVDTYSSGTITKTFDPYYVNSSGLTTSQTYRYADFDGSEIVIDSNTYFVDTSYDGSQVGEIFLGQTFTNGISTPDINIKSGEIVYVDNRVSVTRQSQQREDIKIIIEF
jgi:hypothetical protein